MPDHTLLSRNSEGRSSGSSVVSNGSMRMATLPVTSIDDGKSRFPKLEECAHFHYEHVELGPLKVSNLLKLIYLIYFILFNILILVTIFDMIFNCLIF